MGLLNHGSELTWPSFPRHCKILSRDELSDDKSALDALRSQHEALIAEVGKSSSAKIRSFAKSPPPFLLAGTSCLWAFPAWQKHLVNTIAQALGLSFNRIQFTPDLMPSDIVGSEILDESRQFKFVKGPLFANIVLADETTERLPKRRPPSSKPCRSALSRPRANVTPCPAFFVLATQTHRTEGTLFLKPS